MVQTSTVSISDTEHGRLISVALPRFLFTTNVSAGNTKYKKITIMHGEEASHMEKKSSSLKALAGIRHDI